MTKSSRSGLLKQSLDIKKGLRDWQSRKSVVISRTSLYRGSPHRGSAVCTRKKRVAHHKKEKPRVTPSPLFLFIFVYFSSFLFSAVRSLSRRMGRRLILEKKLTQTKSTVSVMRLCNQLKEAGILNVLRWLKGNRRGVIIEFDTELRRLTKPCSKGGPGVRHLILLDHWRGEC